MVMGWSSFLSFSLFLFFLFFRPRDRERERNTKAAEVPEDDAEDPEGMPSTDRIIENAPAAEFAKVFGKTKFGFHQAAIGEKGEPKALAAMTASHGCFGLNSAGRCRSYISRK